MFKKNRILSESIIFNPAINSKYTKMERHLEDQLAGDSSLGHVRDENAHTIYITRAYIAVPNNNVDLSKDFKQEVSRLEACAVVYTLDFDKNIIGCTYLPIYQNWFVLTGGEEIYEDIDITARFACKRLMNTLRRYWPIDPKTKINYNEEDLLNSDYLQHKIKDNERHNIFVKRFLDTKDNCNKELWNKLKLSKYWLYSYENIYSILMGSQSEIITRDIRDWTQEENQSIDAVFDKISKNESLMREILDYEENYFDYF